ncbi:hypothetical protein HETIRDRAFT_321925 [Heterobasidion irregulare TC 32-1]|uniref:DUF6533 domain-containing protein n=1 Tax=Heterobasidion irregulare (strain TC 32-1) TaxID=747525 RepID=W4K120_HETIT|nr:uncharacterized protein HETIRDRAFT_321925 [Heterobasidion irregulare TC 32-1]ETW79533.1 hypothetical protein HETIRDRAFT_321925 [Heterobasidion irregulare TC 32-1]
MVSDDLSNVSSVITCPRIAASACILFWDWCLTFERERTIIWVKGPWSLARFCYVFIRYVAVVSHCFSLYVMVSTP